MHPAVELRREFARGCGYRTKGGYYLVCDGEGVPCGRMPIPLVVCPVCGGGIKPSRGWTWVDGDLLTHDARQVQCKYELGDLGHNCTFCPLRDDAPLLGRCGLLWVGEKFYSSPREFTLEAQELGISRKINSIPREFKLGSTWVFLAHRQVYLDGVIGPAIFLMFKPSRIEAVVDKKTTDDEIEDMLKRGITPVMIERLGDDVSPLLAALGIDDEEEIEDE